MLNFLVNPKAGGKNGKKIEKAVKTIKEYLDGKKIEYKIYYTAKKGDATTITEELTSKKVDNIIAVGGDGTLHEVINGFKDFSNTALGIIPCGTGNDFASSLKIPFNVIDAVEHILNGIPKFTDFMQMPTIRGLNIIGMGMDVEVLKKYEKLKRKTKFGYYSCLIKTLLKFDYTKFTTIINGEKTEHDAFMACIANGNQYGGGIRVCPIADPTDKELNFLTVNKIKKSKILGALIKLLKGKILTLPQTKTEKIKNIKIECETPYTVNVDGELYENIPFEIEIVSNKLMVYR